MFCSKCGKEIEDQAIICPGCGCPTENYNKSVAVTEQTTSSPDNKNNIASAATVARFSAEVKSIWVLSLIGLLLCLGIGIIFSLIALSKIKKLPAIDSEITDPRVMSDYEIAKRKLKSASTMASIGFCVPAFLILFSIVFFVFSRII